ncbi:unnamed protein product, partial [Orchesella dallaii]
TLLGAPVFEECPFKGVPSNFSVLMGARPAEPHFVSRVGLLLHYSAPPPRSGTFGTVAEGRDQTPLYECPDGVFLTPDRIGEAP